MCRWVEILTLKVIYTTFLIVTNKQLHIEQCVNRMIISPVGVLAIVELHVVHTCTTYTLCCSHMYHIQSTIYMCKEKTEMY
jgi:hypothetical protein